MEKIIQQGAEAQIVLDNEIITKRRIKKSYRLPQLDEKIRKKRTKREYNLITKASKLISIPKIIKFKPDYEIEMEFIKGKKLSENLNFLDYLNISNQIGKQIATLHDNNIIHGDLTTSNMLLSKKNNKLYFIYFGLSFTSHKIEDKAVDLHLIKEALQAKHFDIVESCFNEIIEGYKNSKEYSKVLQRLKKVESRGRYKPQY